MSHLYCVHKEKTSDTVRKTWLQLGKKEYTDNVYPTYLPFFKVLNSDTSSVSFMVDWPSDALCATANNDIR